MAGTLAFDHKEALYNQLKLHVDWTALNTDDAIWYEDRSFFEGRKREVIWLGNFEWDNEQAVGLGNARRDEFFRQEVNIESHTPGDSQLQANNRVKGWMQKLEVFLKNPRWSGIQIVDSQMHPQILVESVDGTTGRGAHLILFIQVHARKTL